MIFTLTLLKWSKRAKLAMSKIYQHIRFAGLMQNAHSLYYDAI